MDKDIYLVTEYVDTDLASTIKAGSLAFTPSTLLLLNRKLVPSP